MTPPEPDTDPARWLGTPLDRLRRGDADRLDQRLDSHSSAIERLAEKLEARLNAVEATQDELATMIAVLAEFVRDQYKRGRGRP